MVSDPRLDAGAAHPPLDHPIGVLLPHFLARELAGLAGRRQEQRRVGISHDAGGGDVFIEVLLQIVVTRNFMLLATFFVQPDPAAGLRITPNVYTSLGEIHTFCDVMEKLIRRGRLEA